MEHHPLQLTRLKYRRTGIIATLGPASREAEKIEGLAIAGAQVFRLNMSHGDHDAHRTAYNNVRSAERALGQPLGVMADLCGPKIRVDAAAKDKTVTSGDTVTVGDSDDCDVPLKDAATVSALRPGHRVLIADGAIRLEVVSVADAIAQCHVIHGGTVQAGKGINLPDTSLETAALTEKDRQDAKFAAELGVDYVALSFVGNANDVFELQMLLAELRCNARIIAKIERPVALAQIDAILDVADLIMVARGDLGVELEPEMVPLAQRLLIDRARARHVPVIVATQMLESMTGSPNATRAEVADVAHAVHCGVDAVMLSGETAVGINPEAAVRTMDRIARETEAYLWQESRFASLAVAPSSAPPIAYGSAIGRATSLLSQDLMVRAIFVVSMDGHSAAEVAGSRPAAPVIVLSPNPSVARFSVLLWGVIPLSVSDNELEDPLATIRALCAELEVAEPGHSVLLVQGFRRSDDENSPSITVVRV